MNQAVRALLLERFGKIKSAPNNGYRIPCPTCTTHNSGKMKRYIRMGANRSKCYICGETLDITELLGKNSADAFKRLGPGVELSEEEEYPYARTEPYVVAQELSSLPADDPCIRFLAKDHLQDLAYYDSIGVRYIPGNGGTNLKFESGFIVHTANTLYFPVYDKASELVGWQLRFIPGTWNGDRFQYMRYMHLFPKGNYLFNYPEASKHDHVIVMEGAKKALKLGNAVATLGKGVSDKQKQLIQTWRYITIMLDGEDSTQKQAEDLAEEFRSNGKQCVNIDPRSLGVDSPDEATTEQLVQAIENAWT